LYTCTRRIANTHHRHAHAKTSSHTHTLKCTYRSRGVCIYTHLYCSTTYTPKQTMVNTNTHIQGTVWTPVHSDRHTHGHIYTHIHLDVCEYTGKYYSHILEYTHTFSHSQAFPHSHIQTHSEIQTKYIMRRVHPIIMSSCSCKPHSEMHLHTSVPTNTSRRIHECSHLPMHTAFCAYI